MSREPAPKWNPQIHQEACEWFVEFRSGDPDLAARKAFHAWLRQSPIHMAAYLDVTALWAESAEIKARDHWTAEALILHGLEDPGNLVALASGLGGDSAPADAPPDSGSKGRAPKSWRTWSIAAGSALAALLLFAWADAQRGVYATDIGEQRRFVLADGSSVELNARSKVRVHFSAARRELELLSGQAIFQVAKDVHRPFIVQSGDDRVSAVGTQFEVYRRIDRTRVTVIEGTVAIAHAQATKGAATASAPQLPMPIYVSAGEQIMLVKAVIAVPHLTNVASATAWTQRRLVFESAPLSEVVEEFNRYNRRQLVIQDGSLNDFEIDGVFSSTDPGAIISFLRSRPGIRVSETAAEFVIGAEASISR